jgi:hypothetical protein
MKKTPEQKAEAWADAMIAVLKGLVEGPKVGGRFTQLQERIATLENRVLELEAQRAARTPIEDV